MNTTTNPRDLLAIESGLGDEERLFAATVRRFVADKIPRHGANLEANHTCERTDEIHTLILGQAITGLAAFR